MSLFSKKFKKLNFPVIIKVENSAIKSQSQKCQNLNKMPDLKVQKKIWLENLPDFDEIWPKEIAN